jgi:mitochondrial fission protein ELM1
MKTIIWRIHDAKPGHANQTRGLVRALAARTDVESHDIPAPTRWQSWRWWLTRQYPPGKSLPRPDLILGAGHGTHVATLAARAAFGGKAIVLMKPSLPLRLFDLCVVPEHDEARAVENLIVTRGVLNVVEPSPSQQPTRGLILIGGPSSAYGWSSERMREQVVAAVAGQPNVHWTLTTSRRTPADFLGLVSDSHLPNLAIVPCEQTGPTWVPNELVRSAQVWATEDSVSMVYEALTSGAAVGLLEVPCNRPGRVTAGVKCLVKHGWVTPFSAWQTNTPLPHPPGALHEAARCASLVCERFQLPRAA